MIRKHWLIGSAVRALCAVLLLATFTACHRHKTSAAVASTTVAANTVRVHYHRNDKVYTDWGVYAWLGSVDTAPTWPTPNYLFTGTDADGWGTYVDIPVTAAAPTMKFLIINSEGSGTKDTGADMVATLPDLTLKGTDIYILSGDATLYAAEPGIQYLTLSNAKAVWITPDTLVWPTSTGSTYKLYVSAAGGITSDATTVSGADASYDLTPTTSLSSALQTQFPQYKSCAGLTLPAGVAVNTVLKGELVVVAYDATGKILQGTSVQTAPVIDAQYGAAAKVKTLGVTFAAGIPTIAVWAPTASVVSLNLYADGTASAAATVVPMSRDDASGVWSVTAPDSTWTNQYYDFNVTVFSRWAANKVVTNTVTDPYSVTLNANSQHSMILNLADPTTAPAGWGNGLLATSATPTDSVLYELSIRDFSASNGNANAGKYLAFTETSSAGMTHLKALADAGMTHVHLLPTFDIASVDEVASVNPTVPVSTGAGLEAQAFLSTSVNGAAKPQDTDWFNWGYDPYHYGAPEGSYSSDPADGAVRVMEFRKMVQALHTAGLRVIMDVVYNHTSDAGQSDRSVLDKIVPGYYYRLDANGAIENDSCCSDTAPEFVMMEKLMTDSLVQWADKYKVDGFRFDIMGFIPKSSMVNALAAVNAVAQADGRGFTYFYGEGWNFGHVINDALFTQARQANMGGTGIGTFNDRMRDSVRGGGPFDSGASVVTNQGFASGLFYDNNDGSVGTAAQKASAVKAQNLISVSLAGNLAAFPLNGGVVASGIDYGGQLAGYTSQPQENIAYVSAHDNETIWDISQYKHSAGTSAADRARAQVVDLSTVILANGVPFIHAGDELLRSKSEDGNSFNSGDYFNRIYWDGSSNNWAVGAPIQNTGNNAANLAQLTTALTNTNATVSQSTILAASAAFQDFLKVRKSSTMFRLPDAASIIGNVRFPDQGLGQIPGVILMQVGDGTTSVGDNAFGSAMTVFNGTNVAQDIVYPWYAGRSVALHPAQLNGSDAVTASSTFTAATGTFHVPARTTAVFVESATNAFTGQNATMYARGSWTTGWDATSPMKLVAPNTWQVSLALTAKAYGFKFDTGSWTTSWGSGADSTLAYLGSGNNFAYTATAAGTYVVTFNDLTLKYSVMPTIWFPVAPTGFSADANANGTSITLAWTPSDAASSYTIYSSPDGIQAYTQLATSSVATYTATGLTTGTPYFYKVTASNALFASAQSAAATATPALGGGPTSQYTAMYMNGNWNGWATLTAGGAMTLTATNTWTVTLTIPAGDLQFKFDTDDSWGGTANATAWTSATTGMTGTAVVSVSGAGNITIPALAAGSYTITFNDTTLAYTVVLN